MRKGCFTVGRGERNYSNKGKKAEVWDLSGFEITSCRTVCEKTRYHET